jgi:hypothetical protein
VLFFSVFKHNFLMSWNCIILFFCIIRRPFLFQPNKIVKQQNEILFFLNIFQLPFIINREQFIIVYFTFLCIIHSRFVERWEIWKSSYICYLSTTLTSIFWLLKSWSFNSAHHFQPGWCLRESESEFSKTSSMRYISWLDLRFIKQYNKLHCQINEC